MNDAAKAGAHSKAVVKALIIPALTKAEGSDRPPSKQISEEDWQSLLGAGQIVEPPYDLFNLSFFPEINGEMGPCIEAMETNIESFGHRLVPVKVGAEPSDEAEAEKVMLENFYTWASTEDTFRALRRKRRNDLEATGNAYWEVIRGGDGRIQGFEHMTSYEVRIGVLDEEPVQVDIPVRVKTKDGGIEIKERRVWRRFRRFVQWRDYGSKKRWFKQFGDPRVLDAETGEFVDDRKAVDFDGQGNAMPDSMRANEVVHWRIYSGRTPYGIPRYIGNLLSILGERNAERVNYVTFRNNNVPSMIVAISNGQLTDGTIQRMSEFVESNVASSDNRSRFLLLEAEPADEEGEDIGHAKIDITPLVDNQHNDALFQNYSKESRDRVRRSWRLPPIFLGSTEDFSRSVAETSRRLADEQVFNPERDEFDDWNNLRLFPELGVKHWRFKSNSPNTTDNAELVRILAGSEKTGGMTPRIARDILEDILGKELPAFPKDFPADQPFSLLMAEAVKNQADPSEPGQQVTALKSWLTKAQVETGLPLFELLAVLEEAHERHTAIDTLEGD